MSDTPRTDKEQKSLLYRIEGKLPPNWTPQKSAAWAFDFARQLERELNSMLQRIPKDWSSNTPRTDAEILEHIEDNLTNCFKYVTVDFSCQLERENQALRLRIQGFIEKLATASDELTNFEENEAKRPD